MTTATRIRARYWASARAVAGCEYDDVAVSEPVTLTDLRARLTSLHQGSRLGEVLSSCSVLLGDEPVSSRDADEVLVDPGSTVEFLPPFAGG